MKMYRLLGPDGFFDTLEPGTLGGNSKTMVYGKLDCRAPKNGLAKGTYQKSRVFFADEEAAVASGYHPCSKCMRDSYRPASTEA